MPHEPREVTTVAQPTDILDTPQAGPAAIRGSLLRVTGYVVGILASVVSVSLLIRHLGVVKFGHYVTVLSLVAIVQGVTDAGLAQLGVREYAIRTGQDRDGLLRNLLGLRLALTSAGVLAATGFAAAAGYGEALVAGTLAAGVGLVLTVVQATFAVPLSAELRLGWVTALEMLRQALSVAAVVALVVAGASLLTFLSVPVPVGILVVAATVALVRGSMPLRPSFDMREWRPLLRAVLPFAAAVAIGTLYLRITVILMSLIATEVQTGYYATSYRVLEVLIAVPGLVVGATLPVLARAARDDRARLEYVLQRLFEATFIVGVWLGLVLVLGAEFAITVLAGEESDPSIPVLQIQALAILANFVASAWLYGLLSLHRHGYLLIISVGALALSVALTLLLVPLLDAQGAAIAFTVGEVAVALGALLFLARARRELRPRVGKPARATAAAAIAMAVTLISGAPSVVQAAIATVVYFAILVALRAIPSEIAEALAPSRPGRGRPLS